MTQRRVEPRGFLRALRGVGANLSPFGRALNIFDYRHGADVGGAASFAMGRGACTPPGRVDSLHLPPSPRFDAISERLKSSCQCPAARD
eukprot:6736348-Prymnesium_polylepis.3